MKVQEWDYSTGKYEIDLPDRAECDIHVVSKGMILLSVQREDCEIPIAIESHNLRFKDRVFGGITLSVQSDAPFGIRARVTELQTDEPRNDAAPPPRSDEGSLFKRLRDRVRQEMGVTREAFLERDVPLPGYELDDGDDGLFEEEQLELLDAQKSTDHADGGDDDHGDQVPAKNRKRAVSDVGSDDAGSDDDAA